MSFRIPALILAAIAYGVFENPWISMAIIGLSIPLPWIAVLIANDRPPRTQRRAEPLRTARFDTNPAIEAPRPPRSSTADARRACENAGVDRDLLLSICPALRTALTRDPATTSTPCVELLGAEAHAALGRGRAGAGAPRAREAGDLGLLVRLFLLADTCPEDDVAAALAPLSPADAVRGRALSNATVTVCAPHSTSARSMSGPARGGCSRTSTARIRPTVTRPDHVLGVGQASLSLLHATPTDRGRHRCSIWAPDAASRRCTRGRVRGHGDRNRHHAAVPRPSPPPARRSTSIDLELLEGSWFEPVAGRTFDRIVANPPFVVSDRRTSSTVTATPGWISTARAS